MATVYAAFTPEGARYLGSSFPQYKNVGGNNFPVTGLYYDAAQDEAAFWRFAATRYPGTGNLTCDLWWYADTASSGDVVWGAALAAVTANDDTQNIETDGLATEDTMTDSHLGTTGQRLHQVSLTMANLDGLVEDDLVFLRVRRLGTDGADTMTGDAVLVLARISYQS